MRRSSKCRASMRVQDMDRPDELAGCDGPAHMEAPRERIDIDLRIGRRWELDDDPGAAAAPSS